MDIKTETGTWYLVTKGHCRMIKSFKWCFESDQYLHQSSGYKTEKEAIDKIWFDNFDAAKSYALDNAKHRVDLLKQEYNAALEIFNEINNQTKAVDCLS